MIDIAKFREAKFKTDRIGYALRGENPTMLARMRSGFVFMMDLQILPGWCVLTAYPQAKDLTALPIQKRMEFLADMHILGEAIEAVTNPVRMNYMILGNTDNYLHAHVHPRYQWEPPERLKQPAFLYPQNEYWQNPKWMLSEQHVALAVQIAEKIESLKQLYCSNP
jgi:diadenosine tetraphosphate (Ap4A) HIT family hydrolase